MKTKIIAEISWGHDGSIEQAIELIKGAKSADADIVSIHITDMNEYMVPYFGNKKGKSSDTQKDGKIFNYLKNINFTDNQWLRLKAEASINNIKLCITPNDLNSTRFCISDIKPDFYTISTSSIHDYELIDTIASQNTPTFLRIGGSSFDEIKKVVRIFNIHNNDDLILIHGFQKMPTNLEDINIGLLPVLKSKFHLDIGLADHLPGDHHFAKYIPSIAVTLGAKYIEKHITINKKLRSEDFYSALEFDEFKEMVNSIRDTELSIGKKDYDSFTENSKQYNSYIRKKIVANQNIPPETTITTSHITQKRCDVGIESIHANSIIGKKAIIAIKKDETITPDKVK